MVIVKEIDLGGRKFSLETGKYAKQANGAIMARYGDTMVLAAVVASPEAKEDQDFFPLQVEYREKTAAAGKIPGGFFKREGRPTEKEILSSRLIDRPIRPMFPETYRNETQVVVTVFSADQENDSDVLGACAASAALMISDIPFDGPIAEVRVGKVGEEWIINPTFKQLEESSMDMIVAGTEESIVMVEGQSKEISEEEMLKAINIGHEAIKKLCLLQRELAGAVKKPKREIIVTPVDTQLAENVRTLATEKIRKHVTTVMGKEERHDDYERIVNEVLETLKDKYPDETCPNRGRWIKEVVHDIEKIEMRQMILSKSKRLDGRGLNDIRQITIEVGLLPRTHGSALFTRGETQSLTSVTLGTKLDEQMVDGLLPESTKRFMLHYNFPPYSVGEVGRYSGTGRREIGHGNLAERSLKVMMPDAKSFPYTVRIVSDILESNGSSSMATVCAGTLALMDAGIPLIRPVAGIAMGLVKEGNGVAVLSDILGNEDHLGDMDFKISGTREGITAFQMDIKIKGITSDIMKTALDQAKAGRFHILDKMEETIATPRADLSPFAPRLHTMMVPTEMIGAIIGPGGKNIRAIVAESGAEINIEDDGTVVIAAINQEQSDKAREMIERIIEIPEVGKVYKGTVKRIMDFGAFVEIIPGKEGLLHISQIDVARTNKVSDVFKVGDPVEVKLLKIDDEGRLNLSRKALMAGGENAAEEENNRARTPRRDSGSNDRRGPRRDNRR